jgi:hypothetical protein
MKHATIRVLVEQPDYSDLPETRYEWASSVYGDIKEELPDNAPRPLGKSVVMTTYVDANLYHDHITGRAVTGVLHFYNQMPIDWFSKKQATVETATYEAEFVAARVAKEQITAHQMDLRYLGVPVRVRHDSSETTNQWSNPGAFLIPGSTNITKHYPIMQSEKPLHQG